MDGDQKLNIIPRAYISKGKEHHPWQLRWQPGHLYCKPRDAKVEWNHAALFSTDLPCVAQEQQAL